MSQGSGFAQFRAAVEAGDDEGCERSLAGISRADSDALMELYERGGDERWWAVRALAHVGGEAAEERLIFALGDENAEIRVVAAHGLGVMWAGMPESNGAQYEVLAARLSDADGLVRQSAADALAQCADAAIPALAGALASEEEAARVRAAYALRKMGTLRTAGLLFTLLNDDNPLIRVYAYEGLDDLGLLETLLLRP